MLKVYFVSSLKRWRIVVDALRLDAVAALAALAAHAPKKQAVESILKKVLTEDKSPEVVRSAMRAKAEIWALGADDRVTSVTNKSLIW